LVGLSHVFPLLGLDSDLQPGLRLLIKAVHVGIKMLIEVAGANLILFEQLMFLEEEMKGTWFRSFEA
jgi:hypothetical protein